MSFTRGAFHFLSAAMVLLSVVKAPVQASTVQDSKVGAGHLVVPPVGSYEPADGIATAADSVGHAQFADIYGGMALVDQGTHVNIYLTKLDPVAERAIQGSAPADDFTFILTPHNEKQALEFHQKVLDHAATIQSNGIHLVAWGPDVKTGKELIQVKGITPAVADYLTSLFGAANIELQNVDYTLMNFDYRSGGSTPWNGRGFITDESNKGDSSWGPDLHSYAQGKTTTINSYQFDLASLATMGAVPYLDTLSQLRMTDAFDTYK